MAQLKRWVIANKLYAGLFLLLTIFAYMDAYQIRAFSEINTPQAWTLYNTYTGPAIWALWLVFIVIIGIIYYLFTKDKSETIGLIAAGLILLAFAVEDVLFFLFSDQGVTQCMQWFNDAGSLVSHWSTMLGESCVSPFAMTSFAIIGIILSYYVFNKLKRAKW